MLGFSSLVLVLSDLGWILFGLEGLPGHGLVLVPVMIPRRLEMGLVIPDLVPLSSLVGSFGAKNGP